MLRRQQSPPPNKRNFFRAAACMQALIDTNTQSWTSNGLQAEPSRVMDTLTQIWIIFVCQLCSDRLSSFTRLPPVPTSRLLNHLTDAGSISNAYFHIVSASMPDSYSGQNVTLAHRVRLGRMSSRHAIDKFFYNLNPRLVRITVGARIHTSEVRWNSAASLRPATVCRKMTPPAYEPALIERLAVTGASSIKRVYRSIRSQIGRRHELLSHVCYPFISFVMSIRRMLWFNEQLDNKTSPPHEHKLAANEIRKGRGTWLSSIGVGKFSVFPFVLQCDAFNAMFLQKFEK